MRCLPFQLASAILLCEGGGEHGGVGAGSALPAAMRGLQANAWRVAVRVMPGGDRASSAAHALPARRGGDLLRPLPRRAPPRRGTRGGELSAAAENGGVGAEIQWQAPVRARAGWFAGPGVAAGTIDE